MFVDIEETLGRELHDVADALDIPALPPLSQQPSLAPRHWQPLLVAASVVLVLAGAVGVVALTRDGQEVQPAPSPSPTTSQTPSQSPSPSPSETVSTVKIPTSAPTIPFVLDEALYVDGQKVPGSWWSVSSGPDGWLAVSTDNTWWWGRGPKATVIPGSHNVPPVISPNGKYVADLRPENGTGTLSAFDTADGTSLGSVPVDLGSAQDGSTVSIRAVTDDGRVIVQGSNTSVLWLPLAGNATVDLNQTAPERTILGAASTGVIVNDGKPGQTDGTQGDPYLAEISDSGVVTRIASIPTHDDVVVSPRGTWLVRTEAGTMGGEVTSTSSLEAQTLDASRQATLTPPVGWGFRVLGWAWEDDDYLVSPVVESAGSGTGRLVRCGVQQGRCVLIDGP